MPRKKAKGIVPADPQKSSAAQFLTYIASIDAEVYLGKNALTPRVIYFLFGTDKLPKMERR